ncbi:MAG: PDDEXK nuclease domain-containing protein [Fibrobacterota bacterium]
MKKILKSSLYAEIRIIIEQARHTAYKAVNFTMVHAYWNIGRVIVEEEQKGKQKAGYGEKLLQTLSIRLTSEYGEGYAYSCLKNYRQFYQTFPISSTAWSQSKTAKSSTVCSELTPQLAVLRPELSWSHYRLIMRVGEVKAREYYMNEAADQNWSVRALDRQINSLYYQRLLASRNQKPVKAEAQARARELAISPQDFIKDPFVLEFLNIKERPHVLERDLEKGLIDKLQQFLLELGKGFAFVARQQRISTETSNFYIDLVFYNYALKCFMLIDLKMGKLTHQDIGQMDMYVRMYEDKIKQKGDNPTIGLILCTEKEETVVKYSVLKGNKQLFASKYMTCLPTESELKAEIEREKHIIALENKSK